LDFSDSTFTLFESEITLTSPNGNENWRIGTTKLITWESNLDDSVKIRLYKSDTLYSSITGLTANDGSFNWNIPGNMEASSDYKIFIKSITNSNIYDLSDSTFILFNPEITIISPNGGENWKVGTKQTIMWNDIISENVKISLYKSDTLYAKITGSTSSDGSYKWNIPDSLEPSSDYKIFIRSISNQNTIGLSENNFTISPDEFLLMQNYPNPFNPNTTIQYSISEKGRVLLEVFDIIGQRIKTLVDEEQDAGLYEISFSSNGLSSGIYLYRMVSGDFVQMKKMILLK